MRSNDAVFVISVAARLAGMHANTLRKYEREQLLSPLRLLQPRSSPIRP